MKDFKTKIKIKAEPDDVWMAFTNPNSIELWTGFPATFTPEAGEEFSLLEGNIQGTVLEATPLKKLTEQWYFEGKTTESIATIKFFPQKNNVLVEVSHVNIPDEAYDNIARGWKNYFLQPVKTFCEIGY